jgi:hypothetical protein
VRANSFVHRTASSLNGCGTVPADAFPFAGAFPALFPSNFIWPDCSPF